MGHTTEALDLIESPDSDQVPLGTTRIERVGGVLYQRPSGGARSPLGTAAPAWSTPTVLGADADQIDINVDSSASKQIEIMGNLSMGVAGDVDVYFRPGGVAVAASGSRWFGTFPTTGPTVDSNGATPDMTKLVITRGGGNANREFNPFYLSFVFPGAGSTHREFQSYVEWLTNAYAATLGQMWRVRQVTTDLSAFTFVRIFAGSSKIKTGSWYSYRVS